MLTIGCIEYCYDIIINSNMLKTSSTNDIIILQSLSLSLKSSLKSLKLKLSSLVRSTAINNDNIFIITISIMETIRVGISFDISTAIGYSNHESITSNDSCHDGYISLLETLLPTWIEGVGNMLIQVSASSKSTKWTKRSLEERIVACFNLLISSLSSRVKSIRDVCSKYLIIIMDKFPWLLLSAASASSSLCLLLDLLGPLSEKYNTYITNNSNVDASSYRIIHEITDGDDNDHRSSRSKSDISDNVFTILIIAYRWMTIGMHKMPSVMSLILQNYVIITNKRLSSLSTALFEHLGVLISKEMMLSQKPSYAINQSINKTGLSKIRAKASRRSLSGLALKNSQPLRATFSNAYPIKMNKYNTIDDNELVATLIKSYAFLNQCAKMYNDYSIGINIIIDNIWASVASIMRLSDLDTNCYDIATYTLKYIQLSALIVIANSCSEITTAVIDSWRWLLSGNYLLSYISYTHTNRKPIGWQSKLVSIGTHPYLHEAGELFKFFLNNSRDSSSITTVVDFIDDFSIINGDDGHITVIGNVIDIFQSRDTNCCSTDEMQVTHFYY